MIEGLFESVAATITFWPATILFLGGGVLLLNFGADWLVNGASNLGLKLGMSPAVIGLTLVAFGTSAPELVVSLRAGAANPALALSNVVGSNIANTALILGCTAMIFPVRVKKAAIRSDGPLSFAAILLVMLLGFVGAGLSRWDGAILLAAFATWMTWVLRQSRKASRQRAQETPLAEEEAMPIRRHWLLDLLFMGVGLAFLSVGADALVYSAIETARAWSIPEVVIGLTIVAGGTSLPELAVSVMAALKRQPDITVGNVLGSNIFNALLILGTASLFFPVAFNFSDHGAPTTLLFEFDIPFCVFLCLLIIPLMAYGRTLGRPKGVFLLALYIGYLAFLTVRSL